MSTLDSRHCSSEWWFSHMQGDPGCRSSKEIQHAAGGLEKYLVICLIGHGLPPPTLSSWQWPLSPPSYHTVFQTWFYRRSEMDFLQTIDNQLSPHYFRVSVLERYLEPRHTLIVEGVARPCTSLWYILQSSCRRRLFAAIHHPWLFWSCLLCSAFLMFFWSPGR